MSWCPYVPSSPYAFLHITPVRFSSSGDELRQSRKYVWKEIDDCGKLMGRSGEKTLLVLPIFFPTLHASACTFLQHCPMPSMTTSNNSLEKLNIYCNIWHLKNYCCSCFCDWKYMSFDMRKPAIRVSKRGKVIT